MSNVISTFQPFSKHVHDADVIDAIHRVPFFLFLVFQSRALLGRQVPQEARWAFDSRNQGCRGH